MPIQSIRRPTAGDWWRYEAVGKPPEKLMDEVVADLCGVRMFEFRRLPDAHKSKILAALYPEMLPRSFRVQTNLDTDMREARRCDCCSGDDPCGIRLECELPEEGCQCDGEPLFALKTLLVMDHMDLDYHPHRVLARQIGVPVSELEQWPLWKYRTLQLAATLDKTDQMAGFEVPPFA